MNDMRKIMESILLETPLQVGDIVGYKNKSYEVVGINPNDWDQVLIKSQTSDAEGWVDDSKLSRNPPVAETVEEIEESSEWEKRHDEFVDAGETATPQMIDSIIRELSDAATKSGSKGGFINSIIGKKSNGELARHKVSAETLARSIQRNKNAEQGTDERKELGQHLIYAQSLLGRVNEESPEIDIDTFLENLEISVKNIISK